jgi:thiosulfate/3-mercaptopyruvate sulfurtransferase
MRIMKPLSVFMVWGILFFCLPSNAPTQQPLIDYSVVVSGDGLKQLVDREKDILIIDALPSSSYQRGHIPGAKNFTFPDAIINMDQWNTSVMGGKSKEDFIRLLGENKDRPIVFYCNADW